MFKLLHFLACFCLRMETMEKWKFTSANWRFSRAHRRKKGLIGKFCEHFHVICPCIQMHIQCSIFNEMLVFMATKEHYKSSTQLSFQMYILNSSVFSFSCWFQFACLCLCQTVSTFVCFLSFYFFNSRSQPTNQQANIVACCYWNESDEEKTNKTHDCFSALGCMQKFNAIHLF